MTLEEMILENLIANDEFSRKVLPFLKKAYFEDDSNRHLFVKVHSFITKYNLLPPASSLEIELKNDSNISQGVLDTAIEHLKTFSDKPDPNKTPWLIDQAEKWCQERAIYIAISESIQIMDGKSKTPKTGIPQLLSDALAVAFDSDLGHDYTEDADDRYEYIHSDVPRIPLDLDSFNRIMRGGASRKTLNMIGAGVNVGKSLHLCHFATASALLGYKVLYISLEMAEEEISARLDANLMDVEIDKIDRLTKQEWDAKITKIKKKAAGNIIIKEYPTKQASVIQFKAFLNELRIKKNFKPDVILVDYLGICSAASLKLGGSINTNTYQGQIAAELRAMGKQYELIVWSAQQLNRVGFASSDPDMDDVADSFDVAGVADFYLMVTQSEELAKLNQYQVKQVKSRYGDKNKQRRFVIGVDKDRMRLYDVSTGAQTLSKGATTPTASGPQNSVAGKSPVFSPSNKPRQGSKNDKFSKFKV